MVSWGYAGSIGVWAYRSNAHKRTNSLINTVVRIYTTVAHVSIGVAESSKIFEDIRLGRR